MSRRWLNKSAEVDAAMWVNVPAETVLAMGLERGAHGR
jgi:hypothetical protein